MGKAVVIHEHHFESVVSVNLNLTISQIDITFWEDPGLSKQIDIFVHHYQRKTLLHCQNVELLKVNKEFKWAIFLDAERIDASKSLLAGHITSPWSIFCISLRQTVFLLNFRNVTLYKIVIHTSDSAWYGVLPFCCDQEVRPIRSQTSAVILETGPSGLCAFMCLWSCLYGLLWALFQLSVCLVPVFLLLEHGDVRLMVDRIESLL